MGKVQSKMKCIGEDKISVKSGDRVKVPIQRLSNSYSSEGVSSLWRSEGENVRGSCTKLMY